MKPTLLIPLIGLLASCGSRNCFPCEDRWTCGGSEPITLTAEADGCFLSGLPGHNLLAADGTITEDGAVVGMASGTGARITVAHPDGGQWLFCTGGGGCHPSP